MTEAFRDHGGPQRQHRRSIDLQAWRQPSRKLVCSQVMGFRRAWHPSCRLSTERLAPKFRAFTNRNRASTWGRVAARLIVSRRFYATNSVLGRLRQLRRRWLGGWALWPHRPQTAPHRLRHPVFPGRWRCVSSRLPSITLLLEHKLGRHGGRLARTEVGSRTGYGGTRRPSRSGRPPSATSARSTPATALVGCRIAALGGLAHPLADFQQRQRFERGAHGCSFVCIVFSYCRSPAGSARSNISRGVLLPNVRASGPPAAVRRCRRSLSSDLAPTSPGPALLPVCQRSSRPAWRRCDAPTPSARPQSALSRNRVSRKSFPGSPHSSSAWCGTVCQAGGRTFYFALDSMPRLTGRDRLIPFICARPPRQLN
jgi:hypothetical protein